MAFFGFEQVDDHIKTHKVRDLFARVTNSYDVMNDVMSGGLHRFWKCQFLTHLQINPHDRILDMASGTGDIAQGILKKYGFLKIHVTAADLTASMLNLGRNRATDKGLIHNIDYVVADAEELPFSDHAFDVYTCSFGLRNVGNLEKSIKEAYRVLKPGGRFYCLEFSAVRSDMLRPFYDAYSFHLIPLFGKYIARDEAAYQYLVESIRRFPNQTVFKEHIEDAGFESVVFENLSGGIVAIHKGIKPSL